jgi:acyl carrier protein
MTDVADRVRKIIVEHLGVETHKVTDDAKFVDDLRADSMDRFELVMAFEQAFHCKIDDDEVEAIVTVGDAIKLVEAGAHT